MVGILIGFYSLNTNRFSTDLQPDFQPRPTKTYTTIRHAHQEASTMLPRAAPCRGSAKRVNKQGFVDGVFGRSGRDM